MSEVTTIGLDIAKHIFQVHGVDGAGSVVIRRKLRRGEVLAFFEGLEPCLVGMEALRDCASLGAVANRSGSRSEAHATYLR